MKNNKMALLVTAIILISLLIGGISFKAIFGDKNFADKDFNSYTSDLSGQGKGDIKGNIKYNKYSYEFLGVFDTVIQFIGYAENEQEFETMVKAGQERFEQLHKLFDIYNDYEGINNIKTINDNAGISPVKVSLEVINLIEFSKEWYYKTGGVVNIALGPVLSIWHEYREEGLSDPNKARIPDMELLNQAKLKTDIEKVKINKEENTVFLEEQGMKLDVGAVAKGFATEIVANELEEQGYTSFVISGGGNIKIVGKPLGGNRSKWAIGIQDPDKNPLIPNSETVDTVYVNDTSIVSSGDYQRFYVVNGKRVHHIIDPETLLPIDHYRAVTVMTSDSGLADLLSTAIFVLPYEQSRKLVESLENVEALWIFHDGTITATDNMKNTLKNLGGATGK
ncbi:MAG: FAD:protein FMN transferase [Lutispora sp.]